MRSLPPKWDPLVAVLVGLLVLGTVAATAGVWEPWEAEQAERVDTLRKLGNHYVLSLPVRDAKTDAPRVELALRDQLVRGSIFLFGRTEMGLRFPALLGGLALLALLVHVGRRYYGRRAAWLAVLAVLGMPLFAFHSRLAIGLGIDTALTGLASLALLYLAASDLDEAPPHWLWGWGAWIATGAAGAAAGVPGVATPLLAAATVVWLRAREEDGPALGAMLRRVLPLLPVVVGVALVGAAWLLALRNLPEGASWTSLLLWMDGWAIPAKTSGAPTFEQFVHQIGFGLFPLGALVPLAFATMLWSDPPADEPRGARFMDLGLGAYFSVAFLAPALAAPASHFALFVGAPAVALAVGVYLSRVLRQPPEPALVVGAVLILALLDSNLKHDTQQLADALLGVTVDSFPPKMAVWKGARLLDLALLALLIVYQGGVHRQLPRLVRFVVYPVHRLRWLNGWLVGLCVTPVLVLWAWSPPWMRTLADPVAGPRLNANGRTSAWLLAAGVVIGLAFCVFHAFRALGRAHRVRWVAWTTSLVVVAALVGLAGQLAPKLREGLNPNVLAAVRAAAGLSAVAAVYLTADVLRGLWLAGARWVPFWWVALCTAALPLVRLLSPRSLAGLHEDVRVLVVAAVLGLCVYLLVWLVVNLRRTVLDGRTDGPTLRFALQLVELADRPTVAPALLFTVLGGWVLFYSFPISRVLTNNFSQKAMVERYRALAADDEPLFKYRVDDRTPSFYTQSLPALEARDWATRAKADERFFAIIPRKQLASINSDFRRHAGRTLPVLDDRSYRLLLISNQLRDDEPDYNPITRAIVTNLIDGLPPEARPDKAITEDAYAAAAHYVLGLPAYQVPKQQRVDINFDDKVRLVGWSLDPPEPRPGSPLDLTLYWLVLDKISGTYKVFVHIDAPGQRIHGDHDPVEGLYPTQNWGRGDLIRDVHRIETVKRTITADSYTYYVGLYKGSQRMTIKSGPRDKENRANVGKIRVR